MSSTLCLCGLVILVCMVTAKTPSQDKLTLDINDTFSTLKEHMFKVDEYLDGVTKKPSQLLQKKFELDPNDFIKTLKEEIEKRFDKKIKSLEADLNFEKIQRLSTGIDVTNQIKDLEKIVEKQNKTLNNKLNKFYTFLLVQIATLNSFKVEQDKMWKILKQIAPKKGSGTEVPVNEWNFTIVKRIRGKTRMDWKTPHLADIVVLRQDNKEVIVVTDVNNHCVKSFWVDPHTNKELRSSLQLCPYLSFPQSIVKLTEHQIAVSCFITRTIYVLNVSPNLSINTTIKTKTKTMGIASMTSHPTSENETQLLTGYSYGMSVISMKGEIVKQLDSMITRKYLKMPMYLALSPTGNVLVSVLDTCLLCITQQKEILWRFSMRSPMGFDSDPQGNVYIADITANKVILLSSDGKFIKEVLSSADGIKGPIAVFFDSIKRRLYITEIMDGSIKIFDNKRRQN